MRDVPGGARRDVRRPAIKNAHERSRTAYNRNMAAARAGHRLDRPHHRDADRCGTAFRALGLACCLLSALLTRPLLALDPDRTLTQYIHRIWQLQQGLPQGTVDAILQSGDGYLWLGTQTGLVRFDGVRFTSFDQLQRTQAEKVWVRDMAEGSDHALWLATNGSGLIRPAQR